MLIVTLILKEMLVSGNLSNSAIVQRATMAMVPIIMAIMMPLEAMMAKQILG